MMKAMILAAGRGTRMGVLTQQLPKPMLSVAGQPLLYYHLQRLKAAGFLQIVINVSYLLEVIIDYLKSQPVSGLDITISVEEEPLETAGGIKHANSLLGEAPFLCINGDVWTDYPLAKLKSFSKTSMAHLVLVENPSHHLQGDFGLKDVVDLSSVGQVKLCGLYEPKWTFSGISVLNPSIFQQYQGVQGRLGSVLTQAMSLTDHTVTGELYLGTWLDVGTPERLQYVNDLALKV